MSVIIYFGNLFLNVIYFFYKFLPTKDKITFISRQSDRPSEDIYLLKQELEYQKPGLEIEILCKKIGKSFLGKIEYFFHMITKQMYALATSKAIVLDGYCITVSMLKHKKELRVVQMWHAMGALKKFGYCSVGEEEGVNKKIATIMKMHKNYDIVFVSSEKCKQLLAPAYKCKEEIMKVMPLPRLDIIMNLDYNKQMKGKIYEIYPELKVKKTILYAPTFRKGPLNKKYIQDLIDIVDYEKYNLIVKLHPLIQDCDFLDSKSIFDKKFSSIDLLCVSDYIITDYSAFIFEAAIAGKPLYRYVPDKEQYEKNRGFLIDIDSEFPGEQSPRAKEIITKIEEEEYDLVKIKRFSEKYIKNTGDFTKNMAKYILQISFGGN